jgi:hypothetical protein
MNRRHKAAQHAQRASVSIHTLLFFRNKPALETAYVLAVAPDSLVVLVPRFGIEGSISLPDCVSSLMSSTVEHDPNKHEVHIVGTKCSGASFKRSIQVFQPVRVRISVRTDNTGARKLEISLVLLEDEIESDSPSKAGSTPKSKSSVYSPSGKNNGELDQIVDSSENQSEFTKSGRDKKRQRMSIGHIRLANAQKKGKTG